jgi:hypothetical protein
VSTSDEIPRPAPPRPPPQRPRRRWWPAAAAALLAVLLAGLGLWRLPAWLGRGGSLAATGVGPSQGLITVAMTGEAQYRSLREALEHAAPGTIIRVLDGGPYGGPFLIEDAERLRDLTIDAPGHAVLENVDAKEAVISIVNTPGVVLRGLQVRARNRQFGISVTGSCEGLTLEQVRMTQPPQSVYAAVVLWPGTAGTAERPIVLRDLDVQCGTLGLVIVGQDAEPAAWVRVENSRFTGPGFQMTLEKAVRDVRVTGNLFVQGKRGISLEMGLPRQSARITIANNTFFNVPEWLGFTESSFDQADISIANNLVVRSKAVQLNGQDLSLVAGQWFRDNWWEPTPEANAGQVRLVAEPKTEVRLLSRDPASPDFLRPAADTMPTGPGVGPAPWAYIGARPPAVQAGPGEAPSHKP